MDEKVILLVEDNADDEALTLRTLKKSKIKNEVSVVRDGAEALDYLFGTGDYAGENRKELPAVILLDLNLPKIGGLEVLKRLRANEETKLVPIVVLTSSDEESDLQESYKNRCNSYVRKPVDFAHFAECIEQLGTYWLLLNEEAPNGE